MSTTAIASTGGTLHHGVNLKPDMLRATYGDVALAPNGRGLRLSPPLQFANPLAPIRSAGRSIVAVAAKRLLLSIRSGQAARLCKRVKAALSHAGIEQGRTAASPRGSERLVHAEPDARFWGTASLRLDRELSAALPRSDSGALQIRGRRALSAFRAVAPAAGRGPAIRPRSRHHEPSRPPRAASVRPRDPAQTARVAAARHLAPLAHVPAQAHLPRIALSRQLALELGAFGARLLLGTVSTVDRVLRAHLGLLGAPLRSPRPGARRARCPSALGARPGRPIVDFYGTWVAARADAFADN